MIYQPFVELVRRVDAIRSADGPDFLVFRALFRFLVQQQLDGTFDVVAVLTPFVVYVIRDAHDINSGHVIQKGLGTAWRTVTAIPGIRLARITHV